MCGTCMRNIPARMNMDQARFLNGIFFPKSGVRTTPATMVSCQVAAASQDSPNTEPKVSGA